MYKIVFVITSMSWNPKIYKYPCIHRFIAGSVKYPTKPLSKVLVFILIAVKDGLQPYQGIVTLVVVSILCGLENSISFGNPQCKIIIRV